METAVRLEGLDQRRPDVGERAGEQGLVHTRHIALKVLGEKSEQVLPHPFGQEAQSLDPIPTTQFDF